MLPRKIKGKCIIKFQRSIDMRVIRTSKYRHAHITNAHFPSFKKGCFLLPLMSFINLFSRDCWLLLITHINSRYARGNLIILIFKVIDRSPGKDTGPTGIRDGRRLDSQVPPPALGLQWAGALREAVKDRGHQA